MTPKQNANNSARSGAASPDIAVSVAQPLAEVKPKKKVIKLNRNGKLLSSPPLVSPRSKSKGRKGEEKNNKETKSYRVVLKYGRHEEERSRIGFKIDEVLKEPSISQPARLPPNDAQPKATHPFFLGKIAQKLESNAGGGPDDSSSKGQMSEAEDKPTPLHRTVAWKDIVFKSQKPTFTKTLDAIGAPWPPNEINHVGVAVRNYHPSHPLRLRGAAASKSKEQYTEIKRDEDVMHSKSRCAWGYPKVSDSLPGFSESLRLESKLSICNLRLPQRVVASGRQMLDILDGPTVSTSDNTVVSTTSHPVIAQVRSYLPITSTAFDQGRANDGIAWTVQYAPQAAVDVLQPAASQLRDWMRSLTTSVTQKTHSSVGDKAAQASKRSSRKKKRRKISNELDGFIASSDDETDEEYGKNVKNSVLISGPAGCGKTASVFAVAKELEFEVFEVHPGMRRSAKDVLDRVGDMTQNHLVQGAESGDAVEPDTSTLDAASINQDIASGKQGTMNRFFSKTQTDKQRKTARKISGRSVESIKAPKAQKQSVILLEEVDILFDEDKGFWSGVMSLINQSKRPVVLTCNDESAIPFDDLHLQATWRYEPPSPDLAVEYLVALAANEGHVLERDSIRTLYRSKGHDLRATITELDFWCQMGIGSQKGGLDWMLDHPSSGEPTRTSDGHLRVFSKDTYASGIGLALPSRVSRDHQQEILLRYAQDYLGISITDWQEASDVLPTAQSSQEHVESSRKRLDDLQRATELLDSRSVLDLFDDNLTAALSFRISTALTPNRAVVEEADIVRAYFSKSEPNELTGDDLASVFEPVTVEKPTFPPALGRLAPSLEGPTSIIATDIAPYIRSIVAYDQRLEQQREILTGGLQGKRVRKTRAARAALEGGNKANTRREKWFSEDMDFDKVMETAGKGWPLWTQDDVTSTIVSQAPMDVSSPEAAATEDDI
jgi:sorting nexin-8